MSLLIGFSGQGFQYPTMFERLKNEDKGKKWLQEAGDVVHQNLLDQKIVEKNLFDPVYAQLLITFLSVGVFRLMEENHLPFFSELYLCGYSLGEVSAFCASAKLSIQEISDLVKQRACLMQEAANAHGLSGLVVLKGRITREMAQTFAQMFNCYIAIVNGEDHYILGGLRMQLERVIQEAKEQGVNKAEFLQITLPSHTPLLSQASQRFQNYLTVFSDKILHYPILNALTGELVSNGADMCAHLANELSHTLQWQKVMMIAKEYGRDIFLELGPKVTLKNMAQDYFSQAFSLEDFASISGLVKYFSS